MTIPDGLPPWAREAWERCEAATKGPWTVPVEYPGQVNYSQRYSLHCEFIGFFDQDAVFIAHSRTDLPRALEAMATYAEALTVIEHQNGDEPAHQIAREALAKVERLVE